MAFQVPENILTSKLRDHILSRISGDQAMSLTIQDENVLGRYVSTQSLGSNYFSFTFRTVLVHSEQKVLRVERGFESKVVQGGKVLSFCPEIRRYLELSYLNCGVIYSIGYGATDDPVRCIEFVTVYCKKNDLEELLNLVEKYFSDGGVEVCKVYNERENVE